MRRHGCQSGANAWAHRGRRSAYLKYDNGTNGGLRACNQAASRLSERKRGNFGCILARGAAVPFQILSGHAADRVATGYAATRLLSRLVPRAS
jgi:hypothetical protein